MMVKLVLIRAAQTLGLTIVLWVILSFVLFQTPLFAVDFPSAAELNEFWCGTVQMDILIDDLIKRATSIGTLSLIISLPSALSISVFLIPKLRKQK
jgi:phosphoglycerol transferase MdoB-like AlkP superfamily enzyme